MHETKAAIAGTPAVMPRKKTHKSLWKRIILNWELYLFIAPAFFYFLIFCYGPMYGIQIAFKNFIPTKG
ncbi:sugar ABC transporter permease, partial [Paenibacillus rhizosphaerae]